MNAVDGKQSTAYQVLYAEAAEPPGDWVTNRASVAAPIATAVPKLVPPGAKVNGDGEHVCVVLLVVEVRVSEVEVVSVSLVELVVDVKLSEVCFEADHFRSAGTTPVKPRHTCSPSWPSRKSR